MAGVQEAVSEVKGQCQWFTSRLAPQPYQFAGLVRRITCDTVTDEEESGNALGETEQHDLLDSMRQQTAGSRRQRQSRGQRVLISSRDAQASKMPQRPANFRQPLYRSSPATLPANPCRESRRMLMH